MEQCHLADDQLDEILLPTTEERNSKLQEYIKARKGYYESINAPIVYSMEI